ncbi:MFS transporter [Chloroflexota bacterium]
MIKRRGFPKIFFGWWTVLAAGTLSFWVGGYHFYGISALFKPIASELGFSRAATSVATGIGRLEGGLEGPVGGWITDRFGPRWIVFVGIFLVGLSLILMNYIDSLWGFYIVWGVVLGTGHNISTTVPCDKAITEWFVKKRGIALGIKWTLTGLGGVLVLPLIAWLIATQGWRITCVIGGMVMWFVGLPLVWFFVRRHRPEYYGLLPDGASVEEETPNTGQMIDRGVKYAAEVQEMEFTLRQTMRTPAYWLLLVAFSCYGLVGPSLTIHMIPLLTDMGINPVRAAGMLAMMVLITLPLRIIGGFLADRVKKQHLRFLLGGGYLLQSLGITIFVLNQTIPMIYAFFILYGIGMGMAYGITHPLMPRYFGRKAFGSIRGFQNLLMTPVAVIAPIYVGWVYDTTSSYITAFALMAGLMAFAAFILPLAPPPQATNSDHRYPHNPVNMSRVFWI